MGKLIPIASGTRFGRLTVLAFAGNDGRKSALWLCRCDCGKETTPMGAHLRDGRTKSCGCLHADMARARGLRGTKPNCIATSQDDD